MAIERGSFSSNPSFAVHSLSELYVHGLSRLTLCDPMDCSLPGSSVHGTLQARILEWVAISYSRDWARVSCISCVGRWILYHCTTWEAEWTNWASCLLSLGPSFLIRIRKKILLTAFAYEWDIVCTWRERNWKLVSPTLEGKFLTTGAAGKSLLCVICALDQPMSIEFSSVAQLCPTLCDPMDCSTPGFTVHYQLPDLTQTHIKLISIVSMMPSNHLNLGHPLLLLPSIFSSIRDFSNESVLWIRWTNYWSFSFSMSPSNGYSGLISFRIDWLDLLTVWKYLKSLTQHHSSKASVLWHSESLWSNSHIHTWLLEKP